MTVQHPCTALFESVGRDEAAYAELLDLFLEDATERVAVIQAAMEAGDVATLTREAHTYKGAAGVLEAHEVASCAHRLEALGRSGSLSGASEIVDRLAAESHRLFNIIRRYRTAFLCAA